MAVEIVKEYSNFYRPETTDWMLGNVFEWQRVKFLAIQGVWFFGEMTDTATFINDNTIKNNSGKSWMHLGFKVGHSVNIIYTEDIGGVETVIALGDTISAINNDELVVTTGGFDGYDTPQVMPGQGANNDGVLIEVKDFVMVVTERPQGIEFTLGHIPNSASSGGNMSSIIDGTETVFKANGLDTLGIGASTNLIKYGDQSGMAIQSGTVKYLNSVSYINMYEVEIAYMFHGVFDETSNFDDLNNLVLPEYFDGSECLTDNFKTRFWQVWNNPNIYTENEVNNNPLLGNTGGFNENFNGGAQPMTVYSIVYKNLSGNVIDTLDHANDTIVEFEISGVPNLTTLQTKATFGFAYIPKDDIDYKNNSRSFHENIFLNTGTSTDITATRTLNVAIPPIMYGYGYDSMRMDMLDAVFTTSGPTARVTFRLSATANLTSFIESKSIDNREFIIWFNSGDYTKPTNLTDRATIIVDRGFMEKAPIVGLPLPQRQRVYEHDKNPISSIGLGSIISYVEDDVICKMSFYLEVPSTDTYKQHNFGVQAKKTATGETVILENIVNDISGGVYEVDGTYDYSINTSRGFKYISGSSKNWIKINRTPLLDFSNRRYYECFHALKIRWEDWIARLDVHSDFVDISELNNGLNNDWRHYFITSGWEIEFFSEMILEDIDGNTVSRKNEYDFKVNDYDSNVNIDTFKQFYRDSDNSLLVNSTDPDTGKVLGVLLGNENTRIECDFQTTDGTVWSPTFGSDSYGVINLEIFRGSGEIEHRQISTVHDSEADNPLIPIAGEPRLKWELITTTRLRLSCLVDPTLLVDAVKYHISYRVESIPRMADTKIMEDDTQKLTEDGVDKILD